MPKKIGEKKKIIKIANCPLCASILSETVLKAQNIHAGVILSNENFLLVKCKDCGLFYLNPWFNEINIWKYYPADYYQPGINIPQSIIKTYRRIYYFVRLSFVNKYSSPGKNLLDFGSGEGGFVKVAQEYGYQASGIDPYINKKKLSDYKFKNNFFDVITLWHVLEHLYHPLDELGEIRRILKKKGRLFLSIPNAASLGFLLGGKHWYHLDTPRHLIIYNKKTIKKMLAKCGFKIIKIYFFPWESPLDLYETISCKLFGQNKYLKIICFLPIFGITFILKTVLSLFGLSETIQIVAHKK